MPVGLRYRGEVAVISPSGMLLNFGEVTLELQRRIGELATAGNQKLVVNLGQAPVFGNQPLAILLGAHMSYAKRRGAVKLCCLTEKDRNLFRDTMLGRVFDIYAAEDEAVASFRVAAASGPPG